MIRGRTQAWKERKKGLIKIQNTAEPEWPSGLQRRACGTDGHGFEPQTSTNACGHICRNVDQKGLAAMLISIQSAGVTPEVNLRNSLHAGDKACKRVIHPGFETQGRHCQKSKTGVSVAPRKGLMSSKKLRKKVQIAAIRYRFEQKRNKIFIYD